MFDTTVTIVGNALNAPELRRTTGTNTLVASFRVASTSRRYDRDSGRWIDGPSLRVRVTCWRRLAEGVAQSVVTGDPLVVTGRMYTRDWVGDDGQHRVSYELEAIAVGHDLSRGFAKFLRHRPAATTSAVEDAESDSRIAGEVSVPVGTSASEPERRGDLGHPYLPNGLTPTFDPPPMTEPYGDFDSPGTGLEGAESTEKDAINVLRAAGLGGERTAGGETDEEARVGELDGGELDGGELDGGELDGDESEVGVTGADETGGDGAEGDRVRRHRANGRRGRGRVPVPA
jgi:single-strand DNA-binding protein